MSKPTTTILFCNTSMYGLATWEIHVLSILPSLAIEGELNGIQGVATLAT
jgi:hypothetical protein